MLFGRWQGLPAVQQVSDMLFTTVNCPHLESEHHFHHCLCRWPTPRVHLVRILASRPDQRCRCRHCPHPRYRQLPQKCSTVRTKQNDFGFFLPQMWVWTVPSDDDAHTVRGARSRSWELQARPGGIAGVEDTGSLMCTEANTRLSSAEIVSSGNVSSGSRDTTRSILSSVRPARFNASQPATSGREVTMSIPTRYNFPSCSLNRTNHMAICSPFVLARESSRQKA